MLCSRVSSLFRSASNNVQKMTLRAARPAGKKKKNKEYSRHGFACIYKIHPRKRGGRFNGSISISRLYCFDGDIKCFAIECAAAAIASAQPVPIDIILCY